ncbi:MAG: type VI secretion system contractile sheath large subunit [Pirellulaceae bacterium]|nr:type VI secretion system contractile sheath large subunit [Pirellulaceae bacterium]
MADDTKTVAKHSDILPQAYEQLTPANEQMINKALQVFADLAQGNIPQNVLGFFKDPDTAKEIVYKSIQLPLQDLDDEIAQHLPGGKPEDATMVTVALQQLIQAIDAKLSQLLAQILHTKKFREMEGSWRGLKYLVTNSEVGTSLKIKVLSAKKEELRKDFEKSSDFDQSQIFKKVYSDQYGSPGGEPFSILVGDYSFGNNNPDLELLSQIREVSADAFAPFIAASDPSLFGFSEWNEVDKPVDLATIFDSVLYAQWNSMREHPDARFITLAMPRVLARGSYGALDQPTEKFAFEEQPLSNYPDAEHDKYAIPTGTDTFCWSNAAYYVGQRITNAFAKYGWCTAIRGYENGGQVEDLPMHYFYNHKTGNVESLCPTEAPLTDRREYEIDRLGFLSLSYYKNSNYAVFFGGQTTQKPLKYDNPDATGNAALSARLPYMLATSRIAHYLKMIGRDKVGSFLELPDAQLWLDRWIAQYICADKFPTPEAKASYPLAEAKISVTPVPGAPGSYVAIAWLRPFLQFEELTTSLRLVVKIPSTAA